MNGSEFHITRLATGLSGAELAKKINKSARTLREYEARKFEPAQESAQGLQDIFHSMTEKLEPLMHLRTNAPTKTFYLYDSVETLHAAHPGEYDTWTLEMYRHYLTHAITILTLKNIPYRILNPKKDK